MMNRTRRFPLFTLLTLLVITPAAQAGDDWLPITPQELAMKESSLNPGAHAVLLYREVDTDDVNTVENHYYRIKILTETGKKYGDIEIPYRKGKFKVGDIKARTVRPDGSEVQFSGEVFDQVLVKARGLKVHVKKFSLPEVQVGSIIEYRYKMRWPTEDINTPEWEVQHELPTHRLNLSFKPYADATVSWTFKLPPGLAPKEAKKGRIELVMENVPGFQEEEFMPPEKEMKYRVDFFYFPEWLRLRNEDNYWSLVGQLQYREYEEFIGKRKGIQQAVAQLVAPDDPPETKLLKIYTRVQQIRNLSYERDRTEKEAKGEKIKTNNHVEDVLKNGYGTRWDISKLFVAMTRAAGFESGVVLVAERDVQFFQRKLMSTAQLDGAVAWVKVDGRDTFYDPGTPSCPFGMLAWLRTAVTGILPTEKGVMFISTPQPTSDQAMIERKGTLQLDEEGNLSGKIQVSYNGLEALTHRLSAFETDDTGRRKELEDEIKGWLPSGATLKLGEVTGWEGFDQPLRAEVEIEIPGFAASAGKRSLLVLGVFQSQDTHPFRFASRVHPVYLRNPYREMDDLTIQLPSTLRVESVPQQRRNVQGFGSYQIVRGMDGNVLRLQRLLTLDGYFFPVQHYGTLRNFFSEVKAGDEEQVVLQNVDAAQRNNNENR